VAELWPWATLAGLGAFHGLNPAMGWLFAVALGRHRQSGRIVLLSLIPIVAGHALSIALVVAAVVGLGIIIDLGIFQLAAGTLLIAWAVYHLAYGRRHRLNVGLQTGMAGLVLWSFLMATAHGAGLMLVPVLIPLCQAATPARELTASGSLPVSLAAIGVHTIAMLAVTGTIAVVVYKGLGLDFLRRGWINFDVLWTVALIGAGGFLILG